MKEIYFLPPPEEARSEKVFTPKKRRSLRAKVLAYFTYKIVKDGAHGSKAYFQFHHKSTELGDQILICYAEARVSQVHQVTEAFLNQIIKKLMEKEKIKMENKLSLKKKLKIIRFRNV